MMVNIGFGLRMLHHSSYAQRNNVFICPPVIDIKIAH
jgi:hypothetical protein